MGHIRLNFDVSPSFYQLFAKDVADATQADGQLVPLRESQVRRRSWQAELAKFLHIPDVPNADDAIDAAGGEVIAAGSQRH